MSEYDELLEPEDLDDQVLDVDQTNGPVCRVCGCSELEPCDGGCIWADSACTLCSRCAR